MCLLQAGRDAGEHGRGDADAQHQPREERGDVGVRGYVRRVVAEACAAGYFCVSVSLCLAATLSFCRFGTLSLCLSVALWLSVSLSAAGPIDLLARASSAQEVGRASSSARAAAPTVERVMKQK